MNSVPVSVFRMGARQQLRALGTSSSSVRASQQLHGSNQMALVSSEQRAVDLNSRREEKFLVDLLDDDVLVTRPPSLLEEFSLGTNDLTARIRKMLLHVRISTFSPSFRVSI